MKVLIVAEHASAAFGGEAILPLHYFRYLLGRDVNVRMVVHERTKTELMSCLGLDIDNVYFIPDLAIMRFFNAISEKLPHRVAVLTSDALIKLTTQILQWSLVRRLVREHNIDVIHQPIPVSPKFPSLLFALGAPVIIGPMNGGMHFPSGFGYMQGTLEKILTTVSRIAAHLLNILIPGKLFAKKLLVANERTRSALPLVYLGDSELLVENGVDLTLFSTDVEKKPNSDSDRSVKLVFLGRLVDWKGVDLLIEAFSGIYRTVPMELHIVGDGVERAALESMAQRLGLNEHIIFHGSVPQEQCPDIIGAMDILVLPSLYECGGAVVLEAMSLNMPVIAPKWGGPMDYLDDTCGVLVDPSGGREVFIKRLKEAILSLAGDATLRYRLGINGRNKVEREFDWNKKIDAILKIYKNVVG